jgi:hypothetical protein
MLRGFAADLSYRYIVSIVDSVSNPLNLSGIRPFPGKFALSLCKQNY